MGTALNGITKEEITHENKQAKQNTVDASRYRNGHDTVTDGGVC